MRNTFLGVQNKILQTKFVSQEQHSLVHNFISLITLLDSSHVQQKHLGKIASRDRARRSSPHLWLGGDSICST
jgi:hypothetical protein